MEGIEADHYSMYERCRSVSTEDSVPGLMEVTKKEYSPDPVRRSTSPSVGESIRRNWTLENKLIDFMFYDRL
jgi:hypothetical protein